MARCKTKHQLRGEKAMKRAKAQKEKFPEQLLRVIRISDIILEVVDARFSEEMRNEKIEEMIESKNKILVLVQTKSDLTQKRKEIPNSIFVSIKTHEGISKFRDR
jgi:ribosome biogenesis GTPase A